MLKKEHCLISPETTDTTLHIHTCDEIRNMIEVSICVGMFQYQMAVIHLSVMDTIP
jgi:hypothetical protein